MLNIFDIYLLTFYFLFRWRRRGALVCGLVTLTGLGALAGAIGLGYYLYHTVGGYTMCIMVNIDILNITVTLFTPQSCG